MKRWKDHVFPSAPFPTEVERRAFLKYTGAGLGGVALSPFLAALNQAMAADSCETVPADKSAMDYTFSAAYAASPPAIDEVAFTMEVENLMALTYGGDFMQYKPVSGQTPGVCVADMGAPGNEGVIGRWVDKWEGSADFKTWTFHIRPGIKSWAGNEMTSADITWTWQRAFEMKAVRYFFAKAMFLDKPDDIEVIDKYTVRFHLQKPSPVILKLMAMSYYGGPFDATEAKKHATAGDPWAKNWLKSNDAGFGPYHIVKNIPGQEMELTRNENYQPKPPIKRILIRIVPDAATRMALIERGAVDYAMRLPERSLQALAKNPAVQIVRARANFIPYIGPVETNEIMAKTKVRQAMAWATPYDEIRQKVYFDQGTPIKSITPAIFPNYTDRFWVYKLDQAKAKALLAEAGYPSGFDLKLSFDNSIEEMSESAVLIKAAYDAVGIRTTLDPLPAAVYSERKVKRQLMCQVDNFQWPWIADTGYTGWVYLGNPETTVNNSVYFNNSEFNQLVTEMMQMPLGEERTKKDLRVQQLAAEEVPWIFLVEPGWREALKKEWTNFHWYPDNNLHLEWLYKS
jgi:peptide/nickel transport system substrate-binding protein